MNGFFMNALDWNLLNVHTYLHCLRQFLEVL